MWEKYKKRSYIKKITSFDIWLCNSCKKKRGQEIPYGKILVRSSTAGSSKVQCEECKKVKRIKFMVKYKGKILCSSCKVKKKFQGVGG